MADHRDLLIEIGTEELPPKALRALATAFADHVWRGLSEAGIPRHGELRAYASPRRLGVFIGQLFERGLAVGTKSWGPFVKAAFDEKGNPTAAAQGFASNCGVEVKDLQTLQTDKGPRLYYEGEKPGRVTVELVPAIVQKALDKLPIPRRMRWGDGDAQFVRPVHWVVLLFGETVIDAELLGVRANRYTRGHRFLHPAPIHLDQPRDYEDALERRGYVIPDFERRRERVQEEVLAAAAREDAHAEITGMLLDEVTALCEWPQALIGDFDPSFLELPEEVIAAVLRDQQRCFPLRTKDGRLLPRFVAIANIPSRDPGLVRHGNERVIRPRLTDAAFFWCRDRDTPLHDRLKGLKEVVFQKQLGTLYDKTQRVSKLAVRIAKHAGADAAHTKRAAELSRCDLLTQMVGEFPELQGIMGRHYAAHDGEPAEVCTAIDEMYRPRFAGDVLPKTPVGRALALADKLDTLAGLFGAGEIPTGDKDPFGLRRAALGAVRIIVECELPFPLQELINNAFAAYEGKVGDAHADLETYMFERFASYLKDSGFSTLQVEAVLSQRPERLSSVPRQLEAVKAFQALPEAESLAAANKRVANILRQAEARGERFEAADEKHLKEPAERALYDSLTVVSKKAMAFFEHGDYTGYLKSFAVLKTSIDAFFDSVMVMVDDPILRRNRLALLADLRLKMNRVADISKLAS
ncbi:MAG TPA: glycine--tRNA ligase subunit beta [Gammaproteobacteria bacterium]|nr:glycine--tRNA ligase subunit beta [Gammaproteobacteria bacterium]